MAPDRTALPKEMDKPIRVLHVEDDPADRERVRRVLIAAGGFEVAEATRAREFERLLAEGEWDCVLTDIQLSGYTGLDVLDRVNAMQLGIPVVFLASGGAEEVAVEAMRRGAADYVLKVSTHYAKLPLVLRNAVAANQAREARSRAQKALEQSEVAYRQLFQANPHPMWIYDAATLAFLEVNEAAVRKYGWSRAEFLGMNIKDIRPPEDVPRLLSVVERGHDKAEGSVWRHLRKDGEMLYVEIISHSLDWDGRSARVVLVNDVTERIRVEEEVRETLAELNTLHEASPVGIALVSNRTLMRGNRAMSDITGYSREELMLLPAERLFASPEAASRFFDVSEPQLAGAGQVSLEQQILCRDGSRRSVRITARGIESAEPWKGEVWVVEDLLETRQAEAALGRLASDLAESQRVGRLGSWSRDFVTGEVVYSAEQYRLLGLEPSSPPPRTTEDFLNLLDPESRSAMAEAYRRLRETGDPVDVEFSVPLPEGGVRWILAAMRAERDADGRVARAFGINQDITERRKAQAQVIKSRDFYKGLLESFPLLSWHTDDGHRCTFVNRLWTEFTGSPPEAAYGTGWAEFIHPDDRGRTYETFATAFAERRGINQEYRLRHRDGTYHWVRDVGGPVYDVAGDFVGFAGSVLDLEERRRAEEALRNSESRLKTVLEAMPVMLDAFDEQGNIVLWNKECERVTGYSAGEIVGNPRAMELLYPDAAYRERQTEQWKARGNEYRDWEWRLRAKDGSDRYVIWSNLSREQPIAGWANWGTGIDITARRLAEQRSEASEKRFRSIMDAAGDAIYIVDGNGRILDFNTAACVSLGYTCEELLRMNIRETLAEGAQISREDMLRIHEDSLVQTMLWSGYHRRKDGSTFPVEVRISGVRVNSEFFVVGIARDVTEARRAEAALRESEARCRTVVEKSTDFIAFLGRDGQIQFVGPAVRDLLGFAPAEMVGRPYTEFVAPQDAALAGGVFMELVAQPESERKVRIAILRKGGGSRAFDFVARNLLEVPAVGGILILGEAVNK